MSPASTTSVLAPGGELYGVRPPTGLYRKTLADCLTTARPASVIDTGLGFLWKGVVLAARSGNPDLSASAVVNEPEFFEQGHKKKLSISAPLPPRIFTSILDVVGLPRLLSRRGIEPRPAQCRGLLPETRPRSDVP